MLTSGPFLLAPVLMTAQCTADFDFGDVPFGISPDPALGETFEEGVIDEPYSDTLHVLMPTVASDLDFPIPVDVDSMVLQTITLNGVEGEALSIEDLNLTLEPNNNGDSPIRLRSWEAISTVRKSPGHQTALGFSLRASVRQRTSLA